MTFLKNIILVILLTVSTLTIAKPDISSKSYTLYDYNSKQYLLTKDENKKLYPASLTKVMTAYVVLKQIKENNINLNDKVHISEKAWKTGGSRSFIEVNTKVSVENLIKGMIVQSGNDASVALAEFIAEDEENFSKLMNKYARKIGMKNSNFKNATGLHHKEHYSTAKDLTILAEHIITEFPEYFHYFSLKSFTYNNITQRSRNSLLFKDDKITGMKTGWTVPAEYCYIGTAEFNGKTYISVILGAPTPNDRFTDAMHLLKYANLFYNQITLSNSEEPITYIKVYGGEENIVGIKTQENKVYSILIDKEKDLKAEIKIKKFIKAPVEKNTVVGKIIYKRNNEIVYESPLLTNKSIKEGGIIKKIKDYFIEKY